VPIEDLSAHWVLDNNVLRFEPLKFRMAHGDVTANISLDANQKPVLGKANVEMAGLNLRELFPPTEKMKKPLGTLFGRVDVAGHGTSVADLLGTADGRLAMLINGALSATCCWKPPASTWRKRCAYWRRKTSTCSCAAPSSTSR